MTARDFQGPAWAVHWAAVSFVLTGMCALISALPPVEALERGQSGVPGSLGLFASVYAGWYAVTAWVLARPGSPEALRKFESGFHRPVAPGLAPAGIALKVAVLVVTVLGVLIANLLTAFAGGEGGWTFWTGAAAAMCGYADAAVVRATPPRTLHGVLARLARAMLMSWLARQSAKACRGRSRPWGTGNGKRKETDGDDLA